MDLLPMRIAEPLVIGFLHAEHVYTFGFMNFFTPLTILKAVNPRTTTVNIRAS